MTNERDLYRRVAVRASIAVAAIGVVGAGIACLAAGSSAAGAACVGAGGALFGAIALPVAMIVGLRRTPQQFGLGLAFALLIVFSGIVALFTWEVGLEGAIRTAFIATFVSGLLVGLAVEVVVVARARIPYVEPVSSS